MSEIFDVGSFVIIEGLQNRPELNRMRGVVRKGVDPQTGRVEVGLISGDIVRIKPLNLSAPMPNDAVESDAEDAESNGDEEAPVSSSDPSAVIIQDVARLLGGCDFAIEEGVLEGPQFVPLRRGVERVINSFQKLKRFLSEGHLKPSTFQKLCFKLLDTAYGVGALGRVAPAGCIELLSVKGLFASALVLFNCWSGFDREVLNFGEGISHPVRVLATAGSFLLAHLLSGNDGLKTMIWKSGVFRRGLKDMIEKLRFTRDKIQSAVPTVYFLLGLQLSAGMGLVQNPEERLVSFRLDVSHLLRSSCWYAIQFCGPSDRWDWWSSFAMMLRELSLSSEFAKSAQRAFAEREADDDALYLFKVATSGCKQDAGLDTQTRRHRFGRRLLTIQCTLSNPAVAEYVYENMVKLLAEMENLRDRKAPEMPGTYITFMAWLQATALMSTSRAELLAMSDCLDVETYKRFAPAVDLQRVKAEDVYLVWEGLESSHFGGKQERFHRTKQELKEQEPPPCSVCHACRPTCQYCGGCKLIVYCGKECCKTDWKRKPGGHKERCALLRENVTHGVYKDSDREEDEETN